MTSIYVNFVIKNSDKSVRRLARDLGIPVSSFFNVLSGGTMRNEYQLRLKQRLEQMRVGPPIIDISLLLPDQARLFYRYAACDEEGRWALFDSPQPPVYNRSRWWYQHDSGRDPLYISGIFEAVPVDLSPPSQCLYQRDLETRLWYKITYTYNCRIFTDEEVNLALKNPRVLTPYERLEKAKLYRPEEKAENAI